MSVDALKLKKGFQKAGIEDLQAERMAEAIRDSLKDGELVTKSYLKAELANTKLQIITALTVIVALVEWLFK